MKKVFAFILAVCLMTCMCGTAFAATYSKPAMGISFILSDNWYCAGENDNNIAYEHSWSDNERIWVESVDTYGLTHIDDVSSEDWNNLCMEIFTNEWLEDLMVGKTSVKSESTQARYEWYGGEKYYRFEKAFTTSGYGYYTQGWYITAFLTAKNNKTYIITYARSDVAGENHFADVTQMLHSMSFAGGYTGPKVGDVIGEVLNTDIKAYVNGAPIRSFNIAGYTAVVAEDLRDYGFEVVYDNNTRSLHIRDAYGPNTSSYWHSANTMPVGSKAMDVYYTDIVTYINGNPVEGYNVNGYTVIFMDDMAAFGDVVWDQWSRSIAFTR